MKQAHFTLTFKDLDDPANEKVQVEFLPCQFQKNIDECNKDIYFDSIIKPVTKDGL
jgi:glutathionyl-hydroquinone reductase